MSDKYAIVYTPEALNDIKKIYSYIAFELSVPNVGENQVNRIRKTIRSLDLFPLRNPIVDWEPWKSMGMRKVPIDNFIVFYTIDDKESAINIIRIVYSGQDIQSLLMLLKNEEL